MAGGPALWAEVVVGLAYGMQVSSEAVAVAQVQLAQGATMSFRKCFFFRVDFRGVLTQDHVRSGRTYCLGDCSCM
jgi:hypothetical protein